MTVPIPDDDVDRVPTTDAGSRRASRFTEHVANTLKNVKSITRFKKQSQPASPGEGLAVIWVSDGTGDIGNDGDLMVMITISGVSKYGTLLNFSAENPVP